MKKTKRIIAAFLTAAVAATSLFSISAAAAENYTADVKNAKEAKVDDGNRQQSYTLEFTEFDPTRMTMDSVITVKYEITDKKGKGDRVELVAQRYPDEQRKDYKGKTGATPDTAGGDGSVWKIVKADSDDGKGTATFKYDSIVSAFGTNDFTNLDKINVEAASEATIKCTGLTITNVKGEKEGTHPTLDKGVAWYWIVIAAAAGVIVVIVVLFIVLGRKSSKAFDVTTGQYIDKKKV